MTAIHIPPEPKDGSSETRGQKIWGVLRAKRETSFLSLERAKLTTHAYQENEGSPIALQKARAFEKIVSEIPIYIDDDQLLAGDYASAPMAREWYPEFTVEWILKELEKGEFPYHFKEKELNTVREICTYWKKRAVMESFFRYLGEEELEKLNSLNEKGSYVFAALVEAQTPKGWNIPNHAKAIKLGYSGIIAEIRAELNKTRALDKQGFEKIIFLRAMEITLNAGILYAKRYARLARKLSMSAAGKRKQELERLAGICDRVPERPARNFFEAVQTMWFDHLLIYLDSAPPGLSFGRVDQFLYPYYANDIQSGLLTQEDAIEVLECLRIKLSSLLRFNAASVREGTSGETQFHNCTIGGQTADGQDAANELSCLWLEAASRTRTPHPTLSVRYHKNLSADFAMRAAELCREGLGYPAWFGDRAAIQYLIDKGVTREEAYDYAMAGCVIHTIPHKTASTWPTVVNMPKILEISLNNGTDPALGAEVGIKDSAQALYDSYQNFYENYQKQVAHFVRYSTSYLNQCRLFRAMNLPDVFGSCFFDDCIPRGESVIGGGARYQQTSMYMLPVGVVDVANSLAAMKKCVFEEKSIAMHALLEALATNFEGREDVRELLLAAPKYGNNDDYVDNIVRDLYDSICRMLDGIDAPYGAKYVNAPHSLSFHGAMGARVGALPSGRLAGISLADGAVSPAQGSDLKGPTAVINSAGKINHVPIFGTLFNLKFHPSALKTEADLLNFLALIRTYLDDYQGKHIQFNVIDRETLLDAREHPENYRNLVVRVAGYSAFWVELNSKIQDELIERTEHRMY